jgi:4-amino-4-deoxy-L-arabinose transferase-like glycosyltransferase
VWLRRVGSIGITPGWIAAGCGLLSFGLYAATVAHGAGWDDSGELAAGVARLGIVHAPGYPLYVLAGWVFTGLEPFGSTALRANLWSGLAAGGAVAAIAYLVAWRTRSTIAALLSAGLLATGGLFWSQAITASAYPLFVLSILLVLVAGYRWYEDPRSWRLAWLATATGTVVVCDRAGLVFVPFVAVLVLVRAGRALARPANLVASSAFLIPWLSVIYLPLRAHIRVFPNHMLDVNLSWWGLTTAPGQQHDQVLQASARLVVHNLLNVGLLGLAELSLAAAVLVPMGVWALRRDRVFLMCGLVPALVSSALVSTTVGSYAFWYLPLLAVGAVAAGCAVPSVRRTLVRRKLPVRLAAVGGLAAACLTGAVAGAAYVGRHDPDATSWVDRVLAAVPHGARLWAPWPPYSALRATQEFDHLRPDVHVVYYKGWGFWKPYDLRRAEGKYIVAIDKVSVPNGIRLVRVGPSGEVERKGLTALTFVGRSVGDPVQYIAQAYRVERCGIPSCSGARGPAQPSATKASASGS